MVRHNYHRFTTSQTNTILNFMEDNKPSEGFYNDQQFQILQAQLLAVSEVECLPDLFRKERLKNKMHKLAASCPQPTSMRSLLRKGPRGCGLAWDAQTSARARPAHSISLAITGLATNEVDKLDNKDGLGTDEASAQLVTRAPSCWDAPATNVDLDEDEVALLSSICALRSSADVRDDILRFDVEVEQVMLRMQILVRQAVEDLLRDMHAKAIDFTRLSQTGSELCLELMPVQMPVREVGNAMHEIFRHNGVDNWSALAAVVCAAIYREILQKPPVTPDVSLERRVNEMRSVIDPESRVHWLREAIKSELIRRELSRLKSEPDDLDTRCTPLAVTITNVICEVIEAPQRTTVEEFERVHNVRLAFRRAVNDAFKMALRLRIGFALWGESSYDFYLPRCLIPYNEEQMEWVGSRYSGTIALCIRFGIRVKIQSLISGFDIVRKALVLPTCQEHAMSWMGSYRGKANE